MTCFDNTLIVNLFQYHPGQGGFTLAVATYECHLLTAFNLQ